MNDTAKLIADDSCMSGGTYEYGPDEEDEWGFKVRKQKFIPHSPEKIMQMARRPDAIKSHGREAGEYAYRGSILPKFISVLQTGKLPSEPSEQDIRRLKIKKAD